MPAEHRRNAAGDRASDLLRGASCGNDLHASRILLCQVEKSSANFLMKLKGFTIESILYCGGSSSRQAGAHRKIEDQCEIWFDRLGREPVERAERGET